MYQQRQVEVVTPKDEPDYVSEFGESGCAVVSPIWSGKKVIGVLDIQSEPGVVFGIEIKSLAELWGRQLGLYTHLADSMASLHQEQEKTEETIGQQSQAYVDLEHQLKGPLVTALRRVQEALRTARKGAVPEIDLPALRGQLRKVYRVSNNVGLFAALAKKKSPPVSPKKLHKEQVVRSLIEYSQDFKRAARKRHIGFYVVQEDFKVLDDYFVEADWALFEHAVNNVLDNAFKYAFSDTQVVIKATVEENRWFVVSVRDKGPVIGPMAALQSCKQRGWRSDEAEQVTGEGAGIGLWIVDEIMKVHRGRLDVQPTERGITEVKLLWRCQKVSTS